MRYGSCTCHFLGRCWLGPVSHTAASHLTLSFHAQPPHDDGDVQHALQLHLRHDVQAEHVCRRPRKQQGRHVRSQRRPRDQGQHGRVGRDAGKNGCAFDPPLSFSPASSPLPRASFQPSRHRPNSHHCTFAWSASAWMPWRLAWSSPGRRWRPLTMAPKAGPKATARNTTPSPRAALLARSWAAMHRPRRSTPRRTM